MKLNKNHVAAICFLLTNSVLSQELYWTGIGEDANFFNESNWADTVSGTPPENGSINPSQPIGFDLFITCDVSATINNSAEVDITSQTPAIFGNTANSNWPYVYTAATLGDGNEGAEQTLTINVTSLPNGGANCRVVKTVSNGVWYNDNPQALSLGINTINVNSVVFDRSVKFQFSSGAIVFDLITLNGSSVYAVTNGPIFMESSKTLQITNGFLDAHSFSGGSLILNENSYVHLSANEPLLSNVQVYINSTMSWLRLNNTPPNLAFDDYISQLFVFDDNAEYPTNIRFDNYYDNGVVIRSQNLDATPLTIYSNENLNGSEASIIIDQIYSGASIPNLMNDNIRSFYLKKGHMLTLAVNEDGTGKSKVFIASEDDLEIHTLPNSLNEGVSFVRVIPWNWVSKKGTGGDIEGMDNTWFYKWNNQNLSDMQREYSPMSWGYEGANDDGDISIYRSKYKSTHVLGFNEPDNCTSQSGQYYDMCDVNVALGVYENLMKTGLRLVSPACTQGAVFDWLYSFNNLAIQNDIRIDVIAVHWYDWVNPQQTPNADPVGVFNRFKNYLTAVHDMFGLPIWITEFNANKYRTNEVNQQFMELALPYLENLDYVERYAWFEPNPTDGNTNGTADFYDAPMNLTEIGEFYKNTQSSPSISAPFYLGPDNLSNEVIVNNFEYVCEPDDLLSNSLFPTASTIHFKVYPNPTTEYLLIDILNIETATIYNIIGRKVIKINNQKRIDISSLSKGVYLIKVYDGVHSSTKKFIKN